eukprot:12870871-Ditylum_brightwellii.AAC.1
MDCTLLAKSINYNTIMLYLKAAALLCEPRRLVSPLVSCCCRKSAWIEAIISEQKRWRLLPNRKEHLTADMILFVCDLADKEGQEFLIAALLDWIIVDIHTRNRKSEWA